MDYLTIVFSLFLTYLVLSVIVFFLINSNVIPSRFLSNYQIDFPAELKFMNNPKVAYWVAKQTDEDKNVILLHGFTRNSGRMNRRAKIYWDLGYNIYLVDNLGHGRSRFILFPSGFQYSWEVRKFIQQKNIQKPIIHGVSMGAIAAAYIAQKNPELCGSIICEALPYDFDNLYINMMNYMRIPSKLFIWIEPLSRAIVWRKFKGKDGSYDVKNISCPLFYIHGEEDKMFNPEDHYYRILEDLKDNGNFESWLVPEARHTRMDQNPQYKDKLIDYLMRYEQSIE